MKCFSQAEVIDQLKLAWDFGNRSSAWLKG